MKHASDELIQYLQLEQSFLMADLYEFQLVDGSTLRYSTFDADFLCDDRLYSSTGPIIRRSRTRCVIGVEVDTLNLEVIPGPNDLLLGAPWLQAAGIGALDGGHPGTLPGFPATRPVGGGGHHPLRRAGGRYPNHPHPGQNHGPQRSPNAQLETAEECLAARLYPYSI
ncbi:MAG: DUF2163 domain-containing protein [Magnetococcales bacterium]|nr:DUF2163 domain-containing protein [Magnetococcales bacterium]